MNTMSHKNPKEPAFRRLLTLLDIRSKCTLEPAYGEWDDLAHSQGLGILVEQAEVAAPLAAEAPGAIHHQKLRVQDLEERGLSPLLIWESIDQIFLHDKEQDAIDSVLTGIVGTWGLPSQSAPTQKPVRITLWTRDEVSAELYDRAKHTEDGVSAWISYAEGESEESEYEETMQEIMDAEWLDWLADAKKEGEHLVIEADDAHDAACFGAESNTCIICNDPEDESWDELFVGDMNSIYLGDIMQIAAHAQREAGIIAAGIYQLQAYKEPSLNWARFLSTAMLTDWLFIFAARPLDHAPAVLAYAKAVEAGLAATWHEALTEVMGSKDAARFKQDSKWGRQNEVQWRFTPMLGELAFMLACGFCRSRKSSPDILSECHLPEWAAGPAAESSSFDGFQLADRVESWKRDYSKLDWGIALNKKMELPLMRFAAIIEAQARNAGWAGLPDFLGVLDMFRHAFRNGPAHSDLVSAQDLATARTLALGAFSPSMWVGRPLFDRHRSLIAAVRPPQAFHRPDNHGGDAGRQLTTLRSNFIARYPSRFQWIEDVRKLGLIDRCDIPF